MEDSLEDFGRVALQLKKEMHARITPGKPKRSRVQYIIDRKIQS